MASSEDHQYEANPVLCVWLSVWVRWANAAYLRLTTANQQKDKGLLAGLHTSYKF